MNLVIGIREVDDSGRSCHSIRSREEGSSSNTF